MVSYLDNKFQKYANKTYIQQGIKEAFNSFVDKANDLNIKENRDKFSTTIMAFRPIVQEMRRLWGESDDKSKRKKEYSCVTDSRP